jgi:hypothetical protein
MRLILIGNDSHSHRECVSFALENGSHLRTILIGPRVGVTGTDTACINQLRLYCKPLQRSIIRTYATLPGQIASLRRLYRRPCFLRYWSNSRHKKSTDYRCFSFFGALHVFAPVYRILLLLCIVSRIAYSLAEILERVTIFKLYFAAQYIALQFA